MRGVADVRVMEIGYYEACEQTQEKHNDAVAGQAQIDEAFALERPSVFALIETPLPTADTAVFDEPSIQHDQQGVSCDECPIESQLMESMRC